MHIYLLGMSSARAASKRACNLDVAGSAFYIRHWNTFQNKFYLGSIEYGNCKLCKRNS